MSYKMRPMWFLNAALMENSLDPYIVLFKQLAIDSLKDQLLSVLVDCQT